MTFRNDELEHRKKQLIYRSMHRGCKETDIILGEFAVANVPNMTEEELREYEKIVNADDHDLYNYVTGRGLAPQSLDRALLGLIASYKHGKQ